MFSCNSASKAQLSPESSSSKRQKEHSLRGQSGREGWGLQAKALAALELLNFGGGWRELPEGRVWTQGCGLIMNLGEQALASPEWWSGCQKVGSSRLGLRVSEALVHTTRCCRLVTGAPGGPGPEAAPGGQHSGSWPFLVGPILGQCTGGDASQPRRQ